MDANNTKFHLLHGAGDWLPVLLDQPHSDAWWDQDRNSVSLSPLVKRLSDLEDGQQLEQAQRRGAAFDHYGNIYWINELRDGIEYQPAATPLNNGQFWRVSDLDSNELKDAGHGDFRSKNIDPASLNLNLRGLTITNDEFLVVGTLQPSGMLVFDLHGGGPPEWFRWPDTVSFDPLDMACTPDGGFWVLGIDNSEGGAGVWRFDKNFRIVTGTGQSVPISPDPRNDFSPLGEISKPVENDQTFETGLALDVFSPSEFDNLIAIESLSNDAFILLDTQETTSASRIHYFNNGELINSVVLDDQFTDTVLAHTEILGHDFAFLPTNFNSTRTVDGTLFVASTNSNQSFELALHATPDQLRLILQPKLLPMRDFGGRAIIASAKTAVYDFADRWLPLTEQPLPRWESEAQISGLIKDGVDLDCVWHRLILDACIPAGTEIVFESRATNNLQDLAELPWQAEPTPYLRGDGSELPFHTPYDDNASDVDHAGSWDLLLQNAVGRYIELRVTLRGNQRSTPRIKSLRMYYPRYSYLNRYLPAVYRQDHESAKFLDRFLANVEGVYTALEDKISHAERLFDTRTTPTEFLDWLGEWLGAFMDPSWDEHRKRLFIDNAYLLFRWRGTPLGLIVMIRLSIDECPDQRIFDVLNQEGVNAINSVAHGQLRIVENFLTRGFSRTLLPQEQNSAELIFEGSESIWEPAMGAGILHTRYQRYLSAVYQADTSLDTLNQAWGTDYSELSQIVFPPLMPQHSVQRRNWQLFVRDHLGFAYAHVTVDDEMLFQDFLARRYRQVSRYNRAYGLLQDFMVVDFKDINLPTQMPRTNTALQDWIEFVSIMLPIRDQAHSFTVMLPTQLGELPAAMEQRRARVEEVVQREKPAHTEFEVKFFWALFQVGSARLGQDTNLGESSRFAAMVLGANFLGQSYLAESHPWSVTNRAVIGRDRLGPTTDIYQTCDEVWRT